MFRNEYKMFCVNCQTNLGQVQVKPEIVCDCGCGFYYTLKSNLENKINDNFLLEIHLSDRPENITWTSKSDDEMVLSQPIIGEDGAVILDNPTSPQITITLPLTDDQINQALHLKILHSLRWLAEWAKRLLKITGGKFIYKF